MFPGAHVCLHSSETRYRSRGREERKGWGLKRFNQILIPSPSCSFFSRCKFWTARTAQAEPPISARHKLPEHTASTQRRFPASASGDVAVQPSSSTRHDSRERSAFEHSLPRDALLDSWMACTCCCNSYRKTELPKYTEPLQGDWLRLL